MGLVIMLNFVLICVQTDVESSKEDNPMWLEVLLQFIFAIYIIEFTVKVLAHGYDVFASWWNYLDVLIILTGFIEIIVQVSGAKFFNTTIIRIIRLFRLLRLIRAAKLFSPLKELRMLTRLMGSAFKTVMWALPLGFTLMSMWATLFVSIIQPLVMELHESDQDLWKDCERCTRAYSTVLQTNLTFLQTIVMHESWGAVSIPVIEAYPWSVALFGGVIFTIIFGLLHVIIAVVVDNASEMRAKDVTALADELEYSEQVDKQALVKMFEQIDLDLSGSMTFQELEDGARTIPELGQRLRVMDIDAGDLKELFKLLDTDHSGEVDVSTFVNSLYRLQHSESKTTIKFVKYRQEWMREEQTRLHEMLILGMETIESRMQTLEDGVGHRVSAHGATLLASIESLLACGPDETPPSLQQPATVPATGVTVLQSPTVTQEAF